MCIYIYIYIRTHVCVYIYIYIHICTLPPRPGEARALLRGEPVRSVTLVRAVLQRRRSATLIRAVLRRGTVTVQSGVTTVAIRQVINASQFIVMARLHYQNGNVQVENGHLYVQGMWTVFYWAWGAAWAPWGGPADPPAGPLAGLKQ